MRKISAFLVVCGLSLAMAACGGGSSTPPPPPAVPLALCAVVITPGKPDTCAASPTSVVLGGSQAFTATGTTAAITWTVSGPGSINANGVYVAPSTFPSPSTVTVKATSGAQSGTAAVQVVYPNDNGVAQSGAIKFGTSGGDIQNESSTACCIGTLGSLLDRGGNKFILSNNHVLGKSDAGTIGPADVISQPGPFQCFSPNSAVGTTSQRATLKPTSNSTTGTCLNSGAPLCGQAPSNVDAAIAAVTGTVDATGSVLDLGPAGPTSIADAPPSGTLEIAPVPGEPVAKSGRTTGLTCSTISSTNTTIIVDYDASCGGATAFAAFFLNQIIVNGGNFSAGGDSGSLIVTSNNARPVALLYAGNSSGTAGNPIQDVLNAFATGTPAVAPTIVGGADHPVSCQPTAQAQTAKVGAQSTQIPDSQQQLVARVREHYADGLMSSNPAIRSVEAGASSDSHGDGALVVELSAIPKTRIPAVIGGVRTKVVFAEGVPVHPITPQDVKETAVIKEAHVQELMSEKGIQGVGVGRSDDNPAETAIVIYTIQGEPHPPIPATIDGIRTKVSEGDRFRAFGWNSQLEPKLASCAKPKAAAASAKHSKKK